MTLGQVALVGGCGVGDPRQDGDEGNLHPELQRGRPLVERELCMERTQFPMLETYSGQNIVLGYNDLDRSKFSKLEYLGPWRALEVVVFFKKWIPEE